MRLVFLVAPFLIVACTQNLSRMKTAEYGFEVLEPVVQVLSIRHDLTLPAVDLQDVISEHGIEEVYTVQLDTAQGAVSFFEYDQQRVFLYYNEDGKGNLSFRFRDRGVNICTWLTAQSEWKCSGS